MARRRACRLSAFTELSFTAPTDAWFRVGMHQLEHAGGQRATPGVRMFCFL